MSKEGKESEVTKLIYECGYSNELLSNWAE